MAGNIKGITIEFDGNTTKLDKALRQVDKETRSIDSELKKVNNALKFNPHNIDLLRQKQTLLKEKISETETRLKALKDAQKQMDAKGVDKNSQAYRNLQREIITTQSKLKTFKSQLSALGNVKLKSIGGKLKDIGGNISAAGRSMRTFSRVGAVVVGLMSALVKKSAQWADDLNTMSKKYHLGTEQLQLYSAAAKLVDTDVETIAKSHIKLTRSMKSAMDGSEKYADAFKQLGVEVTNSDGSMRDADAVWQEAIHNLGQMSNETERDALAMQLMGKSAADLNPLIEDGGETYARVAKTMKKYGLDFIDEDALKKANEFNDTIDTIKAVGVVAFQQIGTELAAYLLPSMQKVVDWVGQLAQWLSNLDPEVVATAGAIAGVIAVLAPLLIIIGSVISAIGTIISFVGTVISGIGTLISIISTVGPAIAAAIAAIPGIGWIIAGIAALIAIGIALWKNWDVVKAKAIEIKDAIIKAWNDTVKKTKLYLTALKTAVVIIWNAIKSAVVSRVNAVRNGIISAFNGIRERAASIFSAVKNAITHPIQTAVGIVRNAISRIKSILSGHISLPHIKLPHFKISGKLSLNPPQVPKLSIDWYKNGGIFTKPTIAGLGEAGPEGIIPLDKLWKKMDAIAAATGSTTINVYGTPGMNTNEIADKVIQKLVALQKQREKAWG